MQIKDDAKVIVGSNIPIVSFCNTPKIQESKSLDEGREVVSWSVCPVLSLDLLAVSEICQWGSGTGE